MDNPNKQNATRMRWNSGTKKQPKLQHYVNFTP